MTFLAHWKLGGIPGDAMDGQAAVDSVGGGSGAHDGVYELGDSGSYPGIIAPPGTDEGLHLLVDYVFGNGHIHTFNNLSDLILNGEMTIMSWFQCGNKHRTKSGGYIISMGASGETQADNYQWRLETFSGGAIRFYWENGIGVDVNVDSIAGILTSRSVWTHIAAVRYYIGTNGGAYGIKFYVNGVLVDTQDNGGTGYPGPDGGANAICYIGRRAEGNSAYPFGVDSVRLYDSDESANVATVYAAEAPDFELNSPHIWPVTFPTRTQRNGLPHTPAYSGERLLALGNTEVGFYND